MSAPGKQLFFIGPEPVPALASGLAVVCADACGISGAELHAFPEAGRSSQALLDWPGAQLLLSERALGAAIWKSSVMIERGAARLGLALANSPAQIARRLENKAYFSQAAAAAGLPVPRAVTGAAGPDLLPSALALGPALIFQLAHGFSGVSTYRATSPAELSQLLLRFAGQRCRIAEEVPGTPVTVTGVALPQRVVIGPASRQLTGIPVLTPHPLGSCGNDFQALVPHREVVEATAARVGDWLQQQGHRGIFGVDLVVADDGRCWCIEVNPRLVASVPLWTLSARDRGETSLLDQHLGCFGFGGQATGPLHCHWSQLILYQRAGAEPGPLPASAASLQSARGQVDQEGTFTPRGQLDLNGPAPAEVALIVRSGARPGHELARLITEGPLTGPDGQLLPAWLALAGRLRHRLEAIA